MVKDVFLQKWWTYVMRSHTFHIETIRDDFSYFESPDPSYPV